jgi:hypothetical protein
VSTFAGSCGTSKETTMGGKRRKRKRIPPKTLERLMAEDENYQALRRSIERMKIELATGKRPPPDFRPST